MFEINRSEKKYKFTQRNYTTKSTNQVSNIKLYTIFEKKKKSNTTSNQQWAVEQKKIANQLVATDVTAFAGNIDVCLPGSRMCAFVAKICVCNIFHPVLKSWVANNTTIQS